MWVSTGEGPARPPAHARAQEEDPLLPPAGIIETDITHVSDRHNEYLGLTLAAE